MKDLVFIPQKVLKIGRLIFLSSCLVRTLKKSLITNNKIFWILLQTVCIFKLKICKIKLTEEERREGKLAGL